MSNKRKWLFRSQRVSQTDKNDPEMDDEVLDSDYGAVGRVDESGNLQIDLLPVAYVDSAKSGDREAIKGTAKAAAEIVYCDIRHPLDRPEPKQQEACIVDWLLDGLEAIANGEEPNVAFGWKVVGAGRGRKKPGLQESLQRQIIASDVLRLVEQKRLSVEKAVAEVAADRNISEDIVWKHYSQFKQFPIWGDSGKK